MSSIHVCGRETDQMCEKTGATGVGYGQVYKWVVGEVCEVMSLVEGRQGLLEPKL